MNLKEENRSSSGMSLEDLVKMNGDAMAILDEVPYQPIIYAVPKEWVESGKALLENAVQFQSTLYSTISTLATQKDLRDVESEVKAELKVVKRELAEKLTDLKEQVGSAKESISSSLSTQHTTALNAIKEEYESQQTKRNRLMWITISASAVLSGLVSGLCLLLVG